MEGKTEENNAVFFIGMIGEIRTENTVERSSYSKMPCVRRQCYCPRTQAFIAS